ncbi:MAG: hypothetical protein LBN00_02305 [Oscillospiraceae bacterium]|jgi:hypothetical protein|nr:hypothetical protein [Oscillospiraceae bacterium]
MKKYPDAAELTPIDELPDLFAFFGGEKRVETAEDWTARRAELSELMQYYLYGHKHATPESASTLRALTEAEKDALTEEFSFFGMTFKNRPEVLVDVTDNGKTAVIKLDAFDVPAFGADTQIAGPYPAVVCVGGLPAEQVATLKQNGYAYISMNTASVYSDGGNNPHTGAYNELYPYRAGEYEFDSGTLMGWAWGISRVIDALKNDAENGNKFNVAWDKTAITGCSRNGKAAVLAAAFDERVGVAAPSDPGGGGLTGFRYNTEGKLWNYAAPEGYNTIYSRNETTQRAIANPDESAWFCSRAQELVHANFNRAPFDMHAVAALVAPRPLICWTGEAQQSWLNSPSTVMSMRAAREVYELLGAGGNIAWVVRDGAHANQDRDLPDLIAIMDVTFGRSATLTRKSFGTLKKEDGSALDGSGVIFPERTFASIAELSRNPYDLENSHIRWARPGKYAIWSDVTYLTEDAPDPDVYTDAVAVDYRVSGNRLVAKTVGASKDINTIEFIILSDSDALRHGLNLTGGSPDGMAIGFTSPIISTPTLLVNGNAITASVYDDGTADGYLERYGVSLKPRGAADIALNETFVFGADGIRLEALPDFTLAISVELTKAETAGMFGPPSVGFTSPFGETPSWDCDAVRQGEAKPNIKADITDADASGVTITFDTPMNTREIGVALDAVTSWEHRWGADGKSVRLAFLSAPQGESATLYLFRLVTAGGEMLAAPIKLTFDASDLPA